MPSQIDGRTAFLFSPPWYRRLYCWLCWLSFRSLHLRDAAILERISPRLVLPPSVGSSLRISLTTFRCRSAKFAVNTCRGRNLIAKSTKALCFNKTEKLIESYGDCFTGAELRPTIGFNDTFLINVIFSAYETFGVFAAFATVKLVRSLANSHRGCLHARILHAGLFHPS